MTTMAKIRKNLPPVLMFLLAGAVLLVTWIAVHHRLPEHLIFLLPTPGAVWAAAGKEAAVLARATFNTMEGALLGFGLAISRRIVEAHGGQLSAAAAPGGGAIFRFTLPVMEEEPVA